MQQLLSLWNALDGRRRVIVGVASVSVFALVLVLARMVGTPSMALLYSGLEPSVSGEVVSALEQRGVAYSVRANAIYVDAAQRDLMRMALAEQGLPSTGSAGYELLENLSGFGTTAQMFDAAYWRAKEGELARTILAWPQVKSVRVHIANPVKRPFSQNGAPVASVSLGMSSGGLSDGQSRALRFLIASAVAGLSPKDVSVIDNDRGLISNPDKDSIGTGFAGNRAIELKTNIERMLSARVGPGNAVVEVTLDTDMDRETIVERRIDPDGRVAISTDTREISGSSSDGDNAQVTVASNLPSGDAGENATESQSASSETRERINYEVSETTREFVRQPGKITRLSVAVLVNGFTKIDTSGVSAWSPRSDAELESLRSLVQSAVGFDATRGDVITIESLEFQPANSGGTLVSASLFSGLLTNTAGILQTGLLALVILGLGVFVIRPVLLAPPVPALEAPKLVGIEPDIGPLPDGQNLGISGPEMATDDVLPDPIAQLRQIISERQDETVEVLRNWIETSEEHV